MIRCSRAWKFKSIPSAPLGMVRQGYGDYVFAKKDSFGKWSPISLSAYKEIYPITRGWIDRPSLDVICEKAQQILGKEAFPIFIPNTLYGLYFIEECIKERLQILEKAKEAALSPIDASAQLRRLPSEEGIQELCEKSGVWSLCHYSNADYASDRIADIKDRRFSHLSHISGLLNNRIVERLVEEQQLSGDGLLYRQIQDATQNLMKFHARINNPSDPECVRIYNAILFEMRLGSRSFLSYYCPLSGNEFAVNIGFDPKATKIIENSIRLECSPEVEDSIILYRGSRFQNESLVSAQKKPVSLSLGSRLLAGCISDAGAMPLSYGVNRARKMQAFVVSKEALRKKEPPFFVPEASSLEQFCSGGEGFHPRTVVPHEMIDQSVFGAFFMRNKQWVGSSQSIEEIDRIFQTYVKQAIILD